MSVDLPAVLFTAPFDFLPSLEPYAGRFDIHFKEAWGRNDLPVDAGYRYWVPNPGQHFVVDLDVLARYPQLRAIVTPSTGVNHIDTAACASRDVIVRSLLDDRAALEEISASAEFTFLHVLNSLRRIEVGYRAISEGRWRDDEARFRGHELAGRRVGLVGHGRIGRRLARYFRAFDCPVAAYDPHAPPGPLVETVATLAELFVRSDIVVVCCVLTAETQGMIDGELLDRLPRGALIVNTSRGEVLRETELVDALARRPDLSFAGDVVTGEVNDRHLQSPLVTAHQAGRVLLTPHISGATVESQHKAAFCALSQLMNLEASGTGGATHALRTGMEHPAGRPST